MADNNHMLLRSNLKQLRLPAIGAEFAKLAREAADANEDYEQYLLRLTELEIAARASNAVQARVRAADVRLPERDRERLHRPCRGGRAWPGGGAARTQLRPRRAGARSAALSGDPGATTGGAGSRTGVA